MNGSDTEVSTLPEGDFELTIDSLAHGGDGIGRDPSGRAVFVPWTCPGDRIAVSIVEEHATFARGAIAEVVEPSSGRRQPPCIYAGSCPGCQWQHVDYGVQLQAKQASVEESLLRIGGLDSPIVREALPASGELHYRNRVEFSLAAEDFTLGYRASDGETVFPVEKCLLIPKEHAGAPRALRGALRYALGGDTQGAYRVGLRVSRDERDIEIDIWASAGPFPRHMVAKTLGDALGASTVTRVVARPEEAVRAVRKVEVLSGRGYWTERLAGHEFAVSAPSFFQVNTVMAGKMVDLVLDRIQPGPDTVVLELYAGVGTLTLPMAASGASVTALEGAGSAVRDLNRNLERAGLFADVIPGDVARSIGEAEVADVAVVDPPRSGMDSDVIAGLVAKDPRRIVYVSCDPATLARDAKRLASAGYTLAEATPIDFFPQTYHIETVAVFDRA